MFANDLTKQKELILILSTLLPQQEVTEEVKQPITEGQDHQNEATGSDVMTSRDLSHDQLKQMKNSENEERVEKVER